MAAPRPDPPPAAPAAVDGGFWERSAGPRFPALAGARIALIAELSIPQCRRYRVTAKIAPLNALGAPARIVDWRDEEASLGALQTASAAVFYRVPFGGHAPRLFKEARRLGLPVFYELDDLIFDAELYAEHPHVRALPPETRAEVLAGARLYRAALLEADQAIASTPALAEAMTAATGAPALLLDNALDAPALAQAEALRAARTPAWGADVGTVVLGYGSGSNTHDQDFARIAPVLADLLRRRPHVRLHLHGPLTTPKDLDVVGDQVRLFPLAAREDFIEAMAGWDVALAPLLQNPFNDAKSAIKWLEAAALGVACVASPTASFRRAVIHGETGLLAGTEDQWARALNRITDDAPWRAALGDAARAAALAEWRMEDRAEDQLRPLAEAAGARPAAKTRTPPSPAQAGGPPESAPKPAQAGGPPDSEAKIRLAEVNLFYAPRRYGGATMVMENLCRELLREPTIEPLAFSVFGSPAHMARRGVRRHEADGVPLFALRGLEPEDGVSVRDERLRARFRMLFADLAVDVVHAHSLGFMTTAPLEAAMDLGLPTIVTLHDAWWLCVRSFMITPDGAPCGQWRIDRAVCEACIGAGEGGLAARFRHLRGLLDRVDLLIAPSAHQRDFHLANGVDPDRLRLLENGVRPPAPLPRRAPLRPDRLRLAYVGGAGPHKGYDWLRAALADLPEGARGRIDLALVDLGRRLGRRDVDLDLWADVVATTAIPPFDQDGLDAFYAGVDALVAPSLGPESFGLSVREASARHVWVVATDAGGVAEAIRPGVNGDLVAPGDTAALQAAILRLLEDPAALRAHVNPHAADIVDSATHARRFTALVRELVGDERTSPS